MNWWQGTFNSTSKLQSDDDSVIVGKHGFFTSRRNRLLNRARKLVPVNESDVDRWRLPGYLRNFPTRSSEQPLPQPLPLPELRVLLQRDPKFAASTAAASMPLPSPDVVQNLRGRDEREAAETSNADVIDGLNGLTRVVRQDTGTSSEQYETRSRQKSSQNLKAKDKVLNNYSISIPTSAPNSPYSSFGLSPPRNYMLANHYPAPLGVFQVWSAPEMPHLDVNPSPSFSSQMPTPEKTSSHDASPLHSPNIRAHTHAVSPPRPASPLNSKLTSDTALARWESGNVQAAVHPLPLPPGATLSSQPSAISPAGSKSDSSGASTLSQPCPLSPSGLKSELMPIRSQWQKGKLLGRGTFGSVYVASNRETGALCAMKEVEILPDDSKSAECIRQLEQEIKVLSNLKHPNIVQYYGSQIIGDKFYIYLEYVHPGSINKFIQDHFGAITESVVRNFTRHILFGLAYLHSKRTIHRDIKGANLLVDAYGVVKLADFGMAKHLTGQSGNLSLKGSPYWMAPELLQSAAPKDKDNSSDIALAVDIWSLGCTIIEMMNGKPPWSEYEGAAALFKALKETPPIPGTLSPEGKDFLQCCFRRNPMGRPSASQLLDHPFLSHSYQPDAFMQPVKEMRSMDNSLFSRDRLQQKLDDHQFPLPLDSRIKKGNLSNISRHESLSPLRVANQVISRHPI